LGLPRHDDRHSDQSAGALYFSSVLAVGCVVSCCFLLFQEGKPEAVIMEAIKTYWFFFPLLAFFPSHFFALFLQPGTFLTFPGENKVGIDGLYFGNSMFFFFFFFFFLSATFVSCRALILFCSLEFCVEVLMKTGETSQESDSAYFGLLASFLSSWFLGWA
jgi:hypothetical protein